MLGTRIPSLGHDRARRDRPCLSLRGERPAHSRWGCPSRTRRLLLAHARPSLAFGPANVATRRASGCAARACNSKAAAIPSFVTGTHGCERVLPWRHRLLPRRASRSPLKVRWRRSFGMPRKTSRTEISSKSRSKSSIAASWRASGRGRTNPPHKHDLPPERGEARCVGGNAGISGGLSDDAGAGGGRLAGSRGLRDLVLAGQGARAARGGPECLVALPI
jgi:hypothetical protein